MRPGCCYGAQATPDRRQGETSLQSCALALGAAIASVFLAAQLSAQDAATIGAAVLRVDVHPRPLPISRLDLPPEDLGFAGGRLATADNMTTGSFMGQTLRDR